MIIGRVVNPKPRAVPEAAPAGSDPAAAGGPFAAPAATGGCGRFGTGDGGSRRLAWRPLNGSC
jgi:hypothetical protein